MAPNLFEMSDKIFPPTDAASANAHISSMEQYRELYERSVKDLDGFWNEHAQKLEWFESWTTLREWDYHKAEVAWFLGGKLNACHNCVDRHVNAGRGGETALIWEGNDSEESRTFTYAELHAEVQKAANVLKNIGIAKGDRVCIYLQMIPELAVAMLACARIGAVHSIIFGGFSAESIRDRVADAGAKVIVTADGGWRRGSIVPLKRMVDEAIEGGNRVSDVIVLKRTQQDVLMKAGRDLWWHELMEDASTDCKPAKLDSEHPLFILYTSGSTGKPKGILHTTGGYLTQVATTSKYVFDLQDEDLYWCTADIGWITGHSYVVYGILANGATSFMYEGAPNFPDVDRFWKLIDKYKINIFYTAPTAIRSFMKWGDEHVKKYSLNSLRLLGTVGEPINPEAWMWYRRMIGKNRCPIVDTYWQTETGGIMISPIPGASATPPGSATRPLPGIHYEILNGEGDPVGVDEGGFLCITKPWPGMLRGVHGDPERYIEQYWSKFPSRGIYFAGDGARRDKNGNFWVMGRVDDVMNVAGHRLSTMEVESALVSHPAVAEAAVVGRPDEIKGTGVVGFVSLEGDHKASEELRSALKQHVAKEIGPIARPDEVRITDSLPKTRSGKIMRRLLRDIAAGRAPAGDTTTLEDYSVLARLRAEEEG